jgi:hypothetical protein
MDLLHQVHLGFTMQVIRYQQQQNSICEITLFITRLDQDWQLHFVGQQICKISSNNNLFLGANLMNNGTAYSTLAAFKTIVSPRDAASISEVPVF